MKNLKALSCRWALLLIPLIFWGLSGAAQGEAPSGEPVLIVGDLSNVSRVLLPTSYVKTSENPRLATYQFILDFKNGMIFENPDQVAEEPLQAACVGERLERIKDLIWKNQICDFSQVKRLPPPGTACLTVVYPDYMILPLAEGSLGIGSRPDSCALPERDLCRLEEAGLLRREVEALTSEFAARIDEGNLRGECL